VKEAQFILDFFFLEMLIGKFNIILILDFACIGLTVYFVVCSPIRSLIESGFDAGNRSDVRLYYGARNLQRMAYQVISIVFYLDERKG